METNYVIVLIENGPILSKCKTVFQQWRIINSGQHMTETNIDSAEQYFKSNVITRALIVNSKQSWRT